MKRSTLVLTLAAAIASGANAQAIYGYSPEESTGTYTSLSSPTVIYNGLDDDEPLGEGIESIVFTPEGKVTETGEVKGFEIGFEFPFAGESVSSFAVAGKGYVILGNEMISVDPAGYGNFFSMDGIVNAVGCVPQRGAQGMENTVVSYQLTDEALVIQFENFGMMTSFWGDPTPMNIQTLLCKDGSVKFIFDDFSGLEDMNLMLSCAVKQGDLFTCLGGTIGEEIITRHNGSEILAATPDSPSGLTITLHAPMKCKTPQEQPSSLMLTPTSTSISVAFEAAEGADNYLALFSTDKDAQFIPTDGTMYSSGDEAGDFLVAYYGPELTFTNEDLKGGTEYYYSIFAVKAYGLDGPVYNTVSPLSGNVATLPEAAKAEVKKADLTTVTLDVEGNEAGDEVVILYNTYCNRDVFGDVGLFSTPEADVKVGDILPVPEDYTPGMAGMPEPENAGVVAYIGSAQNGIVISDLDPSTGYYFAVYSRNAKGQCSSDVAYASAATTIMAPYDGNSDNFPRYSMPQGWSSSEADTEARTFSFRDEALFNFREGTVSQGTQIIQQRAQLTRGNAEGMTAWMQPQPIDVNDRHITVKFDLALTESANRFDTHAYNDWAEGDMIEVSVSDNEGETWETILTVTSENKPEFGFDTELFVPLYSSIEADLNSYRGKTVNVRLQWTTHTIAGFGANMYVDRISVYQATFPEVPVVSVSDVTAHTATISWKSDQEDYEVAYGEKGSEEEVVRVVKGSKSYQLTDLNPLTEYTVRVRGILEGEDQFSEWSDPVEFTTSDWPAVDAPENLVSDLEDFEATKEVTLSWDATEEMESFEVAYREASSTEWVYVTSTVPNVKISNLKYETRYVWKVRAYCSHERITDYSAQANFTTPQDRSAISAILIDEETEVYTLDGLKISGDYLSSGSYILIRKGEVKKVVIK